MEHIEMEALNNLDSQQLLENYPLTLYGYPLKWIPFLSGLDPALLDKNENTLENLFRRHPRLIIPHKHLWWRPLRFVAPNNSRVAIIGRKPYRSPDANDGLAFSCFRQSVPHPVFTQIFREIDRNFSTQYFQKRIEEENYSLSNWCHQGVVLLNLSLTVENALTSDLCWSQIVLQIIRNLAEMHRKKLVIMAWGIQQELQDYRLELEGFSNVLCSSDPREGLFCPSYKTSNTSFRFCDHFKECNRLLGPENMISWN